MSIEVEQVAERRVPTWVLGVVSAAAAVGVTLVFVALGSGTSEPDATESGGIVERRLSDQVPGLSGTLHAVLSINRTATYLRWPADAASPELHSIASTAARFNADVSQIGLITFFNDEAGDLRVGMPPAMRGITPDVTAFAWHDDAPDRIAVTRTLEGGSLWVAELLPETYAVLRIGAVERGSEVVAYGEWGFALHSAPDADGNQETIVLTPDGDEVSRLPGLVVHRSGGPDGGVLVAEPDGDGRAATSTGAGAVLVRVETAGGLLAVAISDDGSSYAELADGAEPGRDELLIVTPEGSRTLDGADPRDWDPSGRFLATIASGQIIVVDATNGRAHTVGLPAARIGDVRLTG